MVDDEEFLVVILGFWIFFYETLIYYTIKTQKN